MSYVRTSSLHAAVSALQPAWVESNGMRMALRIAGAGAAMETVALADMSCLLKAGLKGPLAAQWLAAQGVPVPPEANTWTALPGDGVIARLGRSEFFLEDGTAAGLVAQVRSALGPGAEGVYPVIRQDCGIVLAGQRANELLVQTCNVNFTQVEPAQSVVVMTQMVGVGVVVIRTSSQQSPYYRIWCDPTFAQYLWETFLEIAAELGGGAIGTEELLK